MWRSVREIVEDFISNSTNTSHTNHTTLHPGNHTDHLSGAHNDGTEAVLFLFLAIMAGAMVRFLFKRLPIPYTVMLIICGLAVGFIAKTEPAIAKYTAIAHMNPHLLLHVFLPILIFESAFSMNVHTFKKTLSQTLVLAGPGLMICTFLTAIMARYIFTYNWNWFEAITFGSVLSATDPVAVVALLKELGASKRLGITIEGESLLNDGFAIVLFKIFFNFVIPNSQMGGVRMFTFVLKIIICGPLAGIGMARVTLFLLSHVYNDALVEITLTLASTYITFWIGEHFEISGVLAVLILGIEINSQKANISPEVEVFLHRFWSMLEYLANTLIFIIVGVVIADSVFIGVEAMDWLFLVALYVGLQVIRFVAIGGLWPILTKIGYEISWRSILVMTWGGLRGAVGLALALIVSQDPRVTNPSLGRKFLFHTAGIVLMSLLINATSVKYLLRVLGMFDISVAKLHTMKTAVGTLRRDRRRSMNMLKSDKFLADSAWEVVEKNTRIRNPYRLGGKGNKREHPMDNPFNLAGTQCPHCDERLASQLRPKELQELSEEVRQRIIKAEKISYWKQFELGMLDRDAVRVLLHTADTIIDQDNKLVEMKDIQHHWRVPAVVTSSRLWLEKLISLQNRYENRSVPEPRFRCLRPLFRTVNTAVFDYVMIAVVTVNVLAILAETLLFYLKGVEHFSFILVNTVFCVVYIAEAVLKLLGLRQYYFYSVFNVLDFLVLIFSVIDTPIMILMFILPAGGVNSQFESSFKNLSFIRAIRIVRIIRFGRVLRLTKLFLPLCLKVVEYFLNRKLKFGYDVGKGYIVGKEEMMKTLCNLTFTPQPILNRFVQASEKARLDTTKQLGLIRKDQPGIAVSIKTTQATRSVLNKCSETIRELQSRGIIDEDEAQKLTQQVEARKKNVQHAPHSIDCSDPRVLLQNLPWVYGLERSAIDYIMERATLINFEIGEVIIRQGDPPDGIHLIINGLAKITQNTLLVHTDPTIDERSRRYSKVQGESWPETHERVVPAPAPGDGSLRKCVSCQSDVSPTGEDTIWSDFIGTGIVLGEMGVLLNSRKNATVISEIPVQTLYIQTDTLFQAIELFPGLGEMLWKVLGMRIAGKLLLGLSEYDECTSQEIQLICQDAYVLTPSEESRLICVDEKVKHVVVISGSCCDEKNHAFSFQSPEIIPPGVRTVRSLTPETRVLVVPKESMRSHYGQTEEAEESEEEPDLQEKVLGLLSAVPHVGRFFSRQRSDCSLDVYSDYTQHQEESMRRRYLSRINRNVRSSLSKLYPVSSRKISSSVHAQDSPLRHSQMQGSLPSPRDTSLHTPSMAVSYFKKIRDGDT